MSAQTQTSTPAKQAARNALFAAGLRSPQPNAYPTHAAYATAWARLAADTLIASGWSKPRQVTTVEELDALPIRSIVAAITHSRNVPIVIVFQRGSNWDGGDGWCTPEAIGQIPSEKVFEFIALNGLPTVFTVLTDGGSL